MAVAPAQPQNVTAQQSDGNILVTWAGSLGATGYIVQRSTDGVNFATIATTGLSTQYLDSYPGIGIAYYYQVAAVATAGTYATAGLAFSGQPNPGSTITIANVLFTAGESFSIGSTTAQTINNLVTTINSTGSLIGVVSAISVGPNITLTAAVAGPSGSAIELSNSLTNVVATPFSNGISPVQSPYSASAMMIAAPPSEMSLYELRLRSQETADRVGSRSVATSEWNAFLRLALYELYDILITSYEDIYSDQYVFINTNGSTQYYPIPDGITNYVGGTYPNSPSPIIPGPTIDYAPNFLASTYNPTYVQATSASLTQLDQRPPFATFYASFDMSIMGNWSGPGNGSLTMSAVNGAAINGSVLDLTGSLNKYVVFSPTNNCDSFQTGTFEFKFTPNYTGSPASPQVLFWMATNGSGANANAIEVYHSGSSLVLQILDYLSVVQVNLGVAFSPVASTTYVITVQYNGTTGSSSIYINGVLQGTSTATFTRSGSLTFGAIGYSGRVGGNANFQFSNLSYYSAVVTPTSSVLSDTIFVATSAQLQQFVYTGVGNVQAFTSLVISDVNFPGYTFNGLYYNGSAWVASNGTYAQSTPATIAALHIMSLPVANTMQINVYYQVSNIPNTAMILNSLVLAYTDEVLETLYPARALYKIIGMDLAVNTSAVSPAWVTLHKYNFEDRNKFVYPNSTSTIYGVYNMGYRLMGNNINFIPTPAGNQTVRIWYAPKLKSLLADTDLTTVGFSGWLRYVIVRAAKYALDKEESDTSRLTEELIFLKQRIEQASQNRDAGSPDTITESRRDGILSGIGWGSGGGNGAGW